MRAELVGGEGDFAVLPGRLQAASSNRPTIPSAAERNDVFKSIKATTLCASGYVSGTILHLKQGTDPHPQGIARRGRGCGGWLQAVRLLFYLAELEE